jgi:hypothetical protein
MQAVKTNDMLSHWGEVNEVVADSRPGELREAIPSYRNRGSTLCRIKQIKSTE